jgi:hypothetical protein
MIDFSIASIADRSLHDPFHGQAPHHQWRPADSTWTVREARLPRHAGSDRHCHRGSSRRPCPLRARSRDEATKRPR